MKEAVVKIDSELMKSIERFMKEKNNRFIFLSKKQVVNTAIIEFLNKRKLDKRKKNFARSEKS